MRDWPRLRAAALQCGLAGLLAAQLLAPPRVEDAGAPEDSGLPDSERREWQSLRAAVETRALAMSGALLKALAALDASGARALPYKGPALAQQLYGDPCLRQFVDLDLVVAPEDVPRALECLQGLGWHTPQPIAQLGSAAYMAAEQEVALRQAGGRVVLELHWRAGSRFVANSLPAAGLLRRARSAQLFGRPVPMPDAVDAALLVAVHAAEHDWTSLEAVAGMAAALAALDERGWGILVLRSTGYRCRRRVGVATALARDLARVRVPPAGLALTDAHTERIAAHARARLLSRVEQAGSPGPGAHTRRQRAVDALWQASALDTSRAVALHVYHRVTMASARDWSARAASAADGDPRLPLWLTRQLRLWRR